MSAIVKRPTDLRSIEAVLAEIAFDGTKDGDDYNRQVIFKDRESVINWMANCIEREAAETVDNERRRTMQYIADKMREVWGADEDGE